MKLNEVLLEVEGKQLSMHDRVMALIKDQVDIPPKGMPKKKKGSLEGFELKTDSNPKDPKEFFKGIGFSMTPADDVKLSGKYQTFKISAIKAMTSSNGKVVVNVGDSTYMTNPRDNILLPGLIGKSVINKVSGQMEINPPIGTKELAPDKFGLAGDLTSAQIEAKIEAKLKSLSREGKYSDAVIKLLRGLPAKVNKLPVSPRSGPGRSGSVDISDIVDDTITDQQLRVISKDFGEILAALWAIKGIKFEKAGFPSTSNEPFLDIYGLYSGTSQPISVKSGGGSWSSVKNLHSALEALLSDHRSYNSLFTPKEKKILDLIGKLATVKNTIVGNFIYLADELKPSGYAELKKATGISKLNSTAIEKWLADMKIEHGAKVVPVLKKKLDRFFIATAKEALMVPKDAPGKAPPKSMGPNEKSWKAFQDGTLKNNGAGIIMYPLSMAVVGKLNSDPNARSALTKLAKSVTMMQMNIDVKKKELKASYVLFQDFDFKWGWQGSTTNPGTNTIGFKAFIGK